VPTAIDPQFILGLLGLGGWCSWQVVRQHRRLRAITGVPRSRIRSAAQGYVELHGKAHVHEGGFLSSPLSGERCLYLELHRERIYSNDSRERSATLERVPEFLLDDGTGEAVVETDGADFSHLRWGPWYYGWTDNPWQARRRGAVGALFQRYRFRERILPLDAEVYLLGDFGTPTARSREDRFREALAALKGDRPRLLARFDADGDGDISLDEWESARTATAEEVGRSLLAEAATAERPRIMKPRHGHQPFIISTETDEARLTGSTRLKLWLAWVGAAGSAVTLLSIASLTARAGG